MQKYIKCNYNDKEYYDNEKQLRLIDINDILILLAKKYKAEYENLSCYAFEITRLCEENGVPVYPVRNIYSTYKIFDNELPIKFDLVLEDEVDYLKSKVYDNYRIDRVWQRVIKGNIWAVYYEDILNKEYKDSDYYKFDVEDNTMPAFCDFFEPFFWLFKQIAEKCYNIDIVYDYQKDSQNIIYDNYLYEIEIPWW